VKEEKAPPPKSSKGGFTSPTNATPPPDVDAEGAEALGRESYVKGLAIIKNPFPWDDGRRSRWDSGWRSESGGDGMGPSPKSDDDDETP
jgi:hypothetical protein